MELDPEAEVDEMNEQEGREGILYVARRAT
jgi:hypothetical protein